MSSNHKYAVGDHVRYTMKEGAENKAGIIKSLLNSPALNYKIKPDNAVNSDDSDVVPEGHIKGKVQ